MPSVDRTSDFLRLVNLSSSRRHNQINEHHDNAHMPHQDPHYSHYPQLPNNTSSATDADTNFNNYTHLISSQISSTEQKLAQLSKLAGQRQIFNDRTAEIESLIFEVKQSLGELNSRIDSFRILIDQRSSGGTHTGVHYQNVLDTFRGRLLSQTRTFRDVLELRTANMRRQDQRRSMYSTAGASTVTARGRPLFAASNSTVVSSSSSAIQRPNEDNVDLEGGVSLQVEERGTMYTHSRAEAMENIQRVIGELGQIFSKVATMVSHHEEMIQRIDDDVDNALHNVTAGEAQLLKYFHTISSSRRLILKVFGVVFVFIVFFVVFLL
eukprot:Lankesteria_metandrocarpae@DN993_c0_g1_i1.p1